MITQSKKIHPSPAGFKKITLRLLLMAAIASSLIGCLSDVEFENLSNALARQDDFHFPSYPVTRPRIIIRIDSVEDKNDSTIRLWGHVNYDSVMIRSAYGVTYSELGGSRSMTKIISAKTDTIDFRKLTNFNYVYNLDLDPETDSLKSKTRYNTSPFVDYISRGDTIRLSGYIYGSFMFETK